MEPENHPIPPLKQEAALPGIPGSSDLVRRDTYTLLSALLRECPSADLVNLLVRLDPEGAPEEMADAWEGLILAAKQYSLSEIIEEYHNLFIGLGCGEIVPYASSYAEGVLMSRPLVMIRRDLDALGLVRQPGVKEPEDHAAALCETMAIMSGSPSVNEARQGEFFRSHMESWMTRFFRDIQRARSAGFYRAAGRVGELFIKSEQIYFSRITINGGA